MRLTAILSSLALAAATVLVATPAAAASPACGDTLTVDTTLVADLYCPADGLRITGDVTLDLGGHLLSGPGVGLAVSNVGTVTIRNGTLTKWDVGVETFFPFDRDTEGVVTGPLVVQNVTFQHTGLGLSAAGEVGTGIWAKPTKVVKSTFQRNRFGIAVNWFGRLVVERSTFQDNTAGVVNSGGFSADIKNSKFDGNEQGFGAFESSSTIQHSTFVDNRVAVSQGHLGGVSISTSDFTGSTTAIDVNDAADVRGSTFRRNATAVALGEDAWGEIVGSTFTGNDTTIRFFPDPFGPLGPISVRGNTFRSNTDGLYVTVGHPGHEIGGNDARNNTGWGLHVPGVTDLGGNTASHNGLSPQCVGVVCP